MIIQHKLTYLHIAASFLVNMLWLSVLVYKVVMTLIDDEKDERNVYVKKFYLLMMFLVFVNFLA